MREAQRVFHAISVDSSEYRVTLSDFRKTMSLVTPNISFADFRTPNPCEPMPTE